MGARNRWLRNTLIAIGFVFPILVIDRNRVFASVFSFALGILLRRDEAGPWPWKAVGSLGFTGVSVFSILGMLRSGPLDNITLPFSAMYRADPEGIKWLLLYASKSEDSRVGKKYVRACKSQGSQSNKK